MAGGLEQAMGNRGDIILQELKMFCVGERR